MKCKICDEIANEYTTDKTDPARNDIFNDSKNAILRFINYYTIKEIKERLK